MPTTSWESLLNGPSSGNNWTGVAGTALANSTTETIITPSSPDFTFNLHAPSLFTGQVIRVTIVGVYSTTGTPTLQLRLRYGGSAGTLLLDSTAITTISGATNASWFMEAWIACRSVGTSGTVVAYGQANGLTAATSFAQLPATGNQATVTIDTTTSKALVLTGTWGTASASNTVQVTQFLVEALT